MLARKRCILLYFISRTPRILGGEATANPLRNVDGSGLPDSSDDRDALADEWADVIDANAFSRDAAWGSARKAVKEGSAGYSPPKGALLGCV